MTAPIEPSTRGCRVPERERFRFLAGARPTARLDDYVQRLKRKETNHVRDKHVRQARRDLVHDAV